MNTRSHEVTQVSPASGLGAGAAAGVVATTVFTLAHHLFIIPIWWAFPFMAVAGALCGAVLAWCYRRLVEAGTGRSWAVFVGMFIFMFGLLALASSIVYEPIITMAEVVESTGGNPIPIGESMGLMVVFTFGWAGFLSVFYRRGWRGFAAALAATAILMLILGVNVSTMGLVEIPTTGWVLVLEFFGYLVALGVSFGLSYRFIERVWRRSRSLEPMS